MVGTIGRSVNERGRGHPTPILAPARGLTVIGSRVPTAPATKDMAEVGDAESVQLDDLHLAYPRVFGYQADSGDGWFYLVDVERVERAIPTVTYPRVIKRLGKSQPQFENKQPQGLRRS